MKLKVGDKVVIKAENPHPLSDAYKKGDKATYLGNGMFEMEDGVEQHCSIPKQQSKIFELDRKKRSDFKKLTAWVIYKLLK